MNPSGKVALVTGGARRLGREMALALARAGADVVVNHAHSPEAAAETVAEIEALGRRALAVRADVAVRAEVEEMADRIDERFGRLDVLVNSASLFESTPFLQVEEAEWDRVLDVNLKGPFLVTQAAVPLLRRGGAGVIVNLTDLSALQASWTSYVPHSVSKAGLVQLTRVLARALAPEIRVNAIAPGTVLPPEDYTEDRIESARRRAALQRIGSPEDVVRALLYLVESDFVTGEVMVVDGGRLLG